MKKIYKTKLARKNIRNLGLTGYVKAKKNMGKLEVLDKVSNNGRIFGVEFIKKDGSTRIMSCRRGVTRYLNGGVNTVSHLPQYLTVFSVNDKGYRNVNLQTIKKIKGCGEVFTF